MIELSILFSVVIVVAIFAGLILRKTEKKINLAWLEAAKKLKLQFYNEDPNTIGKIEGIYNSHLIQVDSLSKSLGPRSNTYTRVKCIFAKPVKITFEFSKQESPDYYGRIVGLKDENIGDDSFDDNVKIKKGKDVSKADLIEFLNPPRRSAVKSVLLSMPKATITNEYIEILLPGLIDDHYLIVNRIKRLAKLADIISKEG